MSLVRRLARPLISAAFVADGWHQVRSPEARASVLHPALDRLRGRVPGAENPELVVKVLGAVQLGAAALFAVGKSPRASATVLLASSLPGAVADYLSQKDLSRNGGEPVTKAQSRASLLTRLSVVGGLLLAAVDLEGRPGLAWRAQQVASDTQELGRRARRSARKAAHKAGLGR